MAIDIFKTVDIIELMDNYLEKVRPPLNIRKQLDLGYIIERQSVILTEIRPGRLNPEQYRDLPYAKASFIKSKNIWKIYWMRGNLNWYLYNPVPEVSTLNEFLTIVDEDAFHCFKG